MTTPVSSFSSSNNTFCHRCRTVSGTNAGDPSNHLCNLNITLYVARVDTVANVFDNFQNFVGGFTLPNMFLDTNYTYMPCPVEMIVTDTQNFIKISHGCVPSGPFYVYMRRDGTTVISFYRVNGSRILSRPFVSVTNLAVHFNAPTSASIPPPPPSNSFPGFLPSSNLPNP